MAMATTAQRQLVSYITTQFVPGSIHLDFDRGPDVVQITDKTGAQMGFKLINDGQTITDADTGEAIAQRRDGAWYNLPSYF